MYWDPFDELEKMHEDMNRMFGKAFGYPERQMIGHTGNKEVVAKREGFRAPVCHMHETENNVIATFEIPGVSKADIELTVDDDQIELKVDQKVEKKEQKKHGEAYSMRKHSFYRCMHLPKKIDSDKATAEYKNGVLRVEMPKHKTTKKKGKKVNVK